MIGRVGQGGEQQLLTLTPAVWGKTRGAVEDTGGWDLRTMRSGQASH